MEYVPLCFYIYLYKFWAHDHQLDNLKYMIPKGNLIDIRIRY